MNPDELKIKVSVEAQLQELRAMEAQFQRQIVQLRTLGDVGSDALKKLERNLGLVRTELNNVGRVDKFNASLGETFRSLPVVGTAMNALNGTAGLVGGAFIAGSYAVAQFRASLNFADQLQDTSEQLNVSASSLQALNVHFGDAGVKAPAVTGTLLKLRQSLAEAAAGSAIMRASFAELGLDAAALQSMALDEALAQVGAGMRNHANSAVAAAAAQDILGRGTARLINSLMDLGGRGLEPMKTGVAEAGRLVEDELVERLAAANQKLEELDQRWTVFKARATVSVVENVDQATSSPLGFFESLLEGLASATDNSRGIPSLKKDKVDPNVALVRAASAQIAADAKKEEDQRAAAEVRARAAAEARAAALKPIQAAQAVLDEKLLALHTSRLAVTDQMVVAESELARLRALMPAEGDESIDAAKQRVDLGEKTLAQEERLDALRKIQAADLAKATADAERLAEQNERIARASRDADNLRAKTAVDQLETERQLLAANDSLEPVQKAAQLAELTERLKRAQEQVVALKRAEIALAGDPLALARAEAELASAEGKLAGIGQGTPATPREIDSLRAINAEATGPNALTVSEAPAAASLRMLNQFGSDGEIVARGVGTAFQGVFDGLRGSIQGLIEGTMTWGDALRNIGSSILSGVIAAISEMFATWIAKRILMHTLGLSFIAAEGAAETAKEASTLPLKTAGAAAAGISSYGLAIAGGLAAIALIAALSGGFATGGPVSGPGTGTSDSIPAWLSTGEYVIPAARVQQYGQGFFDDIRAGRTPELASAPAGGGGGGGGAAAGAREPSVSMHQAFFFDREEAMRSALNSPAGRRMFTDLLRQVQHEI